jgi:serine/threonine protein phosphatase PrpC
MLLVDIFKPEIEYRYSHFYVSHVLTHLLAFTSITSHCIALHCIQVFAVFDGHGGPEVARFCQLYLVSTLTQQPTWQFEREGGSSNSSSDAEKNPAETEIGEALISAFHALDRMIDDPARRYVE